MSTMTRSTMTPNLNKTRAARDNGDGTHDLFELMDRAGAQYRYRKVETSVDETARVAWMA